MEPGNHPSAEPAPSDDANRDITTRKAASASERIVKPIPTAFGKLVTLAGLRLNSSGKYRHPQLDTAFPHDIVDSVLKKRHEKAFSEWLNLGLEEQHKQLAEFFCGMWVEGKPRLPVVVRQALVPAAAREAERALFLSDLDCMLAVLEVRES